MLHSLEKEMSREWMIQEWELRGSGTRGSDVNYSGSAHCRAVHGVQRAVDTAAPILGARQDPTELDLGNVSWLAENKHLLYNFQLNIIQLLSITEEIAETAA